MVNRFKWPVLVALMFSVWFYWTEVRPVRIRTGCLEHSEQVFGPAFKERLDEGGWTRWGAFDRGSRSAFIEYKRCLAVRGLESSLTHDELRDLLVPVAQELVPE